MPARIEIDVVVGPAITHPPALLPFLKAGMEAAVERVRAAGESGLPRSGLPRKKNAPGYGPLAGSLTTLVVTAGPTDGASGFVRTPVFYAPFLEWGTQPHPIVAKFRARPGERRGAPRRRGALMWGPPSSPTFRLAVQHPGIRGRHWMRGAAEGQRGPIEQAFTEQARRWSAAFGAGA